MSDEHEILLDVTVVIPTIGRRVLADCLRSIVGSETWPRQVIVVDQSNDEDVGMLVEEMRRSGISMVHAPMEERGIAIATNRGFVLSRTPIVAVTHDDCRVREDWLRTLCEAVASAARPAVVTGRVLPEQGSEVPSVITSPVPATYTRPLVGRDVLYPANMAVHREIWETVGPLDEDPLLRAAAEDNEWAYRILRAGIPIHYRPQAVVTHLAWRDDATLTSGIWTYARSQGAFYGKYLRHADLFIARRAALDLARAGWWLLRGLVTRNDQLAVRGRAGSFGLARGIVDGMRTDRPLAGTGLRRGRGRR